MEGTTNTFSSMGANFKAAYPEVAMKGKKRKWKVLGSLLNNHGSLDAPKPPYPPKAPKY